MPPPYQPAAPVGATRAAPWQAWLMLALVPVIVAAGHWPVLSAQALAFDDDMYLRDNALVRRPRASHAARFLTEVLEPSTVDGYYQPLTMISLMLDCAAGGRVDDLRAFHRTSLLLHAANALLVALLLFSLFQSALPAAAAALLFGLHPLTVESVSWIAERKTLLASFFALLCLCAYVRHARGGGRAWFAASLGAYALSLLAKPTGILLPIALLLLDVWPRGRFGRRAVVEKLPFIVPMALSAVVTVISQGRTATATLPGEAALLKAPLVFSHNVVFYLSKIAWPAGLTCHYPPPEPMALAHRAVWTGVLGTAALAAILIVAARRAPFAIVATLTSLVLLLPTMGIIGFTNVVAADRYLYLPAVGLLLAAAQGLNLAWNHARDRTGSRLPAIAVIGGVALLAALETRATRAYLSKWRTSLVLAEHVHRLAPDAIEPMVSYGAVLHGEGRSIEAAEVLQQAVDRAPDHWRARTTLAGVLLDLGRIDEAKAHAERAVIQAPHSAKAHVNFGVALARSGDSAAAIAHLETAIRLEPDAADGYGNLGNVLAMIGRLDDAAARYRQALSLQPDFAGLHFNLALVLVQAGRADEAVAQLRQALAYDPHNLGVRTQLGLLLLELRRHGEAASEFREILSIAPDHSVARQGLQQALAPPSTDPSGP